MASLWQRQAFRKLLEECSDDSCKLLEVFGVDPQIIGPATVVQESTAKIQE